MRAANSHPSYQDLSVAAYELLQRLHHLLPVLRLLEVGVARSVGLLHTKRTERVFPSVSSHGPDGAVPLGSRPAFPPRQRDRHMFLDTSGSGVSLTVRLTKNNKRDLRPQPGSGRSHLFSWRAASRFKCITRRHWIFPVFFCALHANPQRLAQPDIRVPD